MFCSLRVILVPLSSTASSVAELLFQQALCCQGSMKPARGLQGQPSEEAPCQLRVKQQSMCDSQSAV